MNITIPAINPENRKYVLSIWALGSLTEIEIDESRYNRLKQARACLSAALAIEEKYELLIANYLDLEKECLALATDNMVKDFMGYSGSFDVQLTLNRRLVNLLTSTRLYIDQLQQNIKACVPDDFTVKDKVKKLLSSEYDEHFEYRFMEALRNYVQHCGLAIHLIEGNTRWTSRDEHGKLEYKLNIFSKKTTLDSNGDFKRKILDEMPETVDLVYAARVYVGAINSVHCKMRDIIAQYCSDSRKLISDAIEEYQAIIGGKPIGLHAICSDPENEAGGTIEKFPLMLNWDEIRIDLIKKNVKLANLERRHVSSSSQTANKQTN